MRKFWRPRPWIWEAILFLVALALQIGGWVSHMIAYILFAAAFLLLVYDIVSRLKNRRRGQPAVESVVTTEKKA
jgi:hypothetical protein